MILSVRDLSVSFATDGGVVRAVEGVSFELDKGEILAIVGESGSGKSVTAQTILGLTRAPNATITGSVEFDGRDLTELDDEKLRDVRGKRIAMIFQDPMTSLNPVYRIGEQIVEMIRAHRKVSKKEARESAVDLLRSVGIPNPERRVHDYPHEFSGGMRQRVMIAMALALDPDDRARRHGAGADPPAAGPLESGARARGRADHTRPRRRRGGRRPGRGDVRGTDRRGRDPGEPLLRSSASLHLGAAGLTRPSRSATTGATCSDRRLPTVTAESANRLPFRRALPARVREVLRATATSRRSMLAGSSRQAAPP
jgi:ABC-type transporter Mla maintaining outer membrane lipid asymmetry ATPase subunit MlaF